ncbi:TIGR03943 family putative permease subunit [Streptomyces sp. NPDC051452]|uniref:TIGR03943 family putative permease subunit n=1 Tax=Streptomyces sp. NPDC051452 TaxID=3365654 RepID=UPI00378CF398
MKRPAQILLLTLTGLGLLQTTVFTDTYLRYVKAGLHAPLIVSGVVLLLLGLAGAATLGRRDGDTGADYTGPGHTGPGHMGTSGVGAGGVGASHVRVGGMGSDHTGVGHTVASHTAADHVGADHTGAGHTDPHHTSAGHQHGHDHTSTPRIAWLMFLPAVSLLWYAPPALGAYTAARSNPKPVTVQKGFAPLPAASPLPLTLTDFTKRVQQDRGLAIKGRTVQLTGFVTPSQDDDSWFLTRIIFTCCAADSQTVKVRMYGTEAPPADTWLAVTGTWHPHGTLGTKTAEAALDVANAHSIAQPVNAFTDDLPLRPS